MIDKRNGRPTERRNRLCLSVLRCYYSIHMTIWKDTRKPTIPTTQ